MDYLFYYLYKKQDYDSEEIEMDNIYAFEWQKLYFKNQEEFKYYLETLSNIGLVELFNPMSGPIYQYYKITFSGLEYAVKIHETGTQSNNCFVAMSFDEEDINLIYDNGILPVLEELGLRPILIVNEHFESDKTINDAIIAAIKKSKFIIADFTKQKRNVYFETGYAAGKGLPVIYMCRNDYFNDHTDVNKLSAFDTNHFPHIIWNDIEDLKIKLKDKIEASIL